MNAPLTDIIPPPPRAGAALPISVVVCAKNEQARIADCLKSVRENHPDEIIVVDGDSSDATVAIARQFTDRVIRSAGANLTRDRQIGIDACRNELIAMIDADHRLAPGDLASLARDLDDFGLDIVQAQIEIDRDGFWCEAEAEALDLVQNTPGEKTMIGVAPALFRARVFEHVKFDDRITSTIDDTDFIYRLSKADGFRIGTGRTRIRQAHVGTLKSYVHKFRWYGRGDAEFCRKHPQRAASMIFHLLVRYPVIHSVKALVHGRFRAATYFVLQGLVRFAALSGGLMAKG